MFVCHAVHGALVCKAMISKAIFGLACLQLSSSCVLMSILFASDRNLIPVVVQFALVCEDDDEDESVPFRIS